MVILNSVDRMRQGTAFLWTKEWMWTAMRGRHLRHSRRHHSRATMMFGGNVGAATAAVVAAGQRRTGQFENLAQRFLQALLSHQDLGQGDERFLRLPWSGHGALTADRIIGGLVRDTRWRNE